MLPNRFTWKSTQVGKLYFEDACPPFLICPTWELPSDSQLPHKTVWKRIAIVTTCPECHSFVDIWKDEHLQFAISNTCWCPSSVTIISKVFLYGWILPGACPQESEVGSMVLLMNGLVPCAVALLSFPGGHHNHLAPYGSFILPIFQKSCEITMHISPWLNVYIYNFSSPPFLRERRFHRNWHISKIW